MSGSPVSEDLIYLGLAVVLVLANGFFVATEFSLVKVRPSRLQTLVEEGAPGAHNVLRMVQRLDAYLSATQFGVTLASLGLGWIGEPAFAHLALNLLSRLLPEYAALPLAHTIAVVIAFALITTLHIIVGELGPKSLSIQRSEQVALAVAWPMRVFFAVCYPGIWVLNRLASRFLKLFGLRSVSDAQEAHSEDELKVILNSSAASGAITASRAELLERALEMAQKTARQIMVPRSQVKFIDLDDSVEKNVADARQSGHTWMPVCRGDLDHVLGVANVKDLFFLLSRHELRSISQVQRPVLFVPENVTLEQLLSEFRKRKRQLAVVADEHGGTSGIVTLSDVVAEVVGEVAELGRRVEEARMLPGGKIELPGTASLEDLADRLTVEFDVEPGEVTTVAGYLMSKLGRIPERGDKVPVGEFEIQVQDVDGPRVGTVLIQPKAPPVPPVPPVTGSSVPPAAGAAGPSAPQPLKP